MTILCTDAFVTIATVNLGESVLFYTQMLGIKPEIFIPNVYAQFQLPGVKLGIFKPKQNHFSEFELAKGKMSLCLEVGNLEVAIAHLAFLGHPPPGEIITAAHGREVYAYDPDGNRLILHQSTQLVNTRETLTND